MTPIDMFFWMFVIAFALAVISFVGGIVLVLFGADVEGLAIGTVASIFFASLGFLSLIIWAILWAIFNSGG